MNQKGHADVLNRFLQEIRELIDEYPRLTHTWRFAASAVWAMGRYYAADKVYRPTSIHEDAYVEDTKTNIDALIENNRLSEDWERGFWFNAAIMRLDALWERLFKLYVPSGVDCNGPSLYALVQARRETPSTEKYDVSTFGRIRQIVNQLKHDAGGAHPSIREDRELPVQMMEDLLAIIRDKTLSASLKPLGTGQVLTGRAKRKR
jgi:hypothetical protein